MDHGVIHPSSFLSPQSPGLTALALKVDSASEAMGAGRAFFRSLSLLRSCLSDHRSHTHRGGRGRAGLILYLGREEEEGKAAGEALVASAEEGGEGEGLSIYSRLPASFPASICALQLE